MITLLVLTSVTRRNYFSPLACRTFLSATATALITMSLTDTLTPWFSADHETTGQPEPLELSIKKKEDKDDSTNLEVLF